MSAFATVWNHVTDKKNRLSERAAIIVLVFVVAYYLDNHFSFSYNIIVNNRLEQIERIEKIKSSQNLDTLTLVYATRLENELINRIRWHDHVLNFINSKYDYFTQPSYPTVRKPIGTTNHWLSPSEVIWYHISAGGLFYLGSIVLTIGILFEKSEAKYTQRAAQAFLTMLMCLIVGFALTHLAMKIPRFQESSLVWNFIVIGVLQLVLIGLFGYLAERESKLKKL